MTRPTAAIVGAGIAGLASASALLKAGWRVEVFESAPELRSSGAGISLMPNAVRALDDLGLGARIRELAETDGIAGIRDIRGRWLTSVNATDFIQRFGTLCIMPRADLLQVLAAALPAGTVRFDMPIARVDATGVVFTAAGSDRYDLVVGADGLRSTVRSCCWPKAKRPEYTGYTAWRFMTDALPRKLGHGAEIWTRGERFGYAPMPGSRAYCFGVQNAPVGGTDTRLPDYGYWPEPVPELVAAASGAPLRDDVYFLPPLDTFVRGSVVLVGDAAHAMPPDLGQGAAQGLEDVVELGRRAPDLKAYDRRRRTRAQRIARDAKRLGGVAQWVSPRGVRLRNIGVRLTSQKRLFGMLSRFLDWVPRD